MIYKNISNCRKQFYGVSFNPGESKEVPGYVNDSKMIVSSIADPVVVKDTKGSKQSNKKSQLAENKEIEAVVETESNTIKEEETNG